MISSKLLKSVAISAACLAALPITAFADPKELVVEGKPGIWFPLESARRLLAVDIELPKVKEKLILVERKLALMDQNLSLLRENLQLEKDVSKRALAIATEEKNRADELQKSLSKWSRSPVLWFAVGVVTATAATIAVSQVVNK